MTSANAALSPSPSAPRPSFLRTTFPSLRVRNYRLYVISQIVTNTCGWMQRVAQDWLILELTGDVAMVGLTVTLQLGPMLLFGLWGGVVADRLDKRRLLMITQSMAGLSALMLGVLALAGAIQPWHILVSAGFLGLATVVDNPARQAFVPEVAGPEHLRNAISINSTVFQLGALIGPALAGASIAAFGEGWSFTVNSAACGVAVTLLAVMRRRELMPAPSVGRGRGQLREGLAYVGTKPEILWTVVLVGFVGLTGINLATVLAAYAADVFDSGSSGYGLLTSAVAVGAVAGSLASTRRRTLRLRHLVIGAGVLGALQMIAGTMRVEAGFVVVLVAVGAAALLYLTGANTMVQTSVVATMRGRVMALYVLVLFGAQAASGTLIGWVAHTYGAPMAMVVTGSGPLLGAIVVGLALTRRSPVRPRQVVADQIRSGVDGLVAHVGSQADRRSRSERQYEYRAHRGAERRDRGPAAGVRRVPGTAGRHRTHRHRGARGRISAHRHRADVPQ